MATVYNSRQHPLKVNVNKADCVRIYQYIEQKIAYLNPRHITESLVREKLEGILNKLEKKIHSPTVTRSMTIRPTEAQAIFYIYQHYSQADDPIAQTEFLTFYATLDSKL